MDPAPTGAAFACNKVRLMCSYGGHISSRPQTKSLYYAGGDTRLISIPDTTNLTLASLITHLSSTLHFSNYPFNLKYQLPNHDLDSLISLSTDEDLLIMLDEHHRLSPSSSRIRLFLFPLKPVNRCCELSGKQLRHPKTESWFADVLKSAELMQKGGVGVGYGEGNNGGEAIAALCGAESMLLETTSLGSSSSSAVSFQNLPAKLQFEDFSVGFLDNKLKSPLSLSDAIASDHTVATAVSHPQTGTYQDPVALENKHYMAPLESENKNFDPRSGVEMHTTVQVSGIPVSYQYDHHQQVVFVHTPAHYVPQNSTMSSYYHMPQQQMSYFVPVGHPRTYNFPATISSNPNPNPSSATAQVPYKVVTESPVPEIASSQVYKANKVATAHVNLPHNAYHRHAVINLQAQSIAVTSLETPTNYSNQLDDDNDNVVHAQIYKSQPPAPALPSQHQTITKSTPGVILSEAFPHLHMDNTKQQLKASTTISMLCNQQARVLFSDNLDFFP
ncbi:protein PAL OF QUIRKY [Euphorbia lathyris]|uniref:protein PAL OF QUIRKY n=1 Tax=Euphorbia lathyris TaxID=212925 RepID=UPI00331344A7